LVRWGIEFRIRAQETVPGGVADSEDSIKVYRLNKFNSNAGITLIQWLIYTGFK
jgi:hypothetical protein